MKNGKVNTQIIIPGYPELINVPGVGFLQTLSSGVTYLKGSEHGKVLFVVPPTGYIVTNWSNSNHE